MAMGTKMFSPHSTAVPSVQMAALLYNPPATIVNDPAGLSGGRKFYRVESMP